MTSTQSSLPESDLKFGYQWWVDDSRTIQFMWGHGGQFAFVVPSHQLVIVMTSIPNTQGEYQIDSDEAMSVVDMVIQAVN
jgi:CubicO group peptidase (beta-lactamase class C family)